jgi:UDP-glucose-4-epimerase GalE
MRRILITGGAGYIGSHTAQVLAQRGYLPVVLDNLSKGHRWAAKYGPLAVGDICDSKLVHRLVRQYNIDSLIHFAALAYVGESMSDPVRYFRNNVSSTVMMLDTLLEAGVRNVVFSSTCATYGVPQTDTIAETHPQFPINPYGESKLAVEKMLRWLEALRRVRHVSLRYFNAAGADPAGELGEAHDPETHLIPLVLQTALGERQSMSVFGTDYETNDGSPVRDFVHVSDLADAHVRALEYLWDGGTYSAFNLGSGRGHSVLEVIRTVQQITGRDVNFTREMRRPGDTARLVADNELARLELGWCPRFSDLETMVQTAWDWMTALRPAVRAGHVAGF